MSLFQAGCFGFSMGAGVMYLWFRLNRLIRTQHEWYSDPVIAAKYPKEAERALSEPDTW